MRDRACMWIARPPAAEAEKLYCRKTVRSARTSALSNLASGADRIWKCCGTVTPGFIESNYTYDAGGRLTQLTTAGSAWSSGDREIAEGGK